MIKVPRFLIPGTPQSRRVKDQESETGRIDREKEKKERQREGGTLAAAGLSEPCLSKEIEAGVGQRGSFFGARPPVPLSAV